MSQATHSIQRLSLAIVLLCVSFTTQADQVDTNSIQACTSIEDDRARLQCYDERIGRDIAPSIEQAAALAVPKQSEQARQQETAPTATLATGDNPEQSGEAALPQGLGGSQFDPQEEQEATSYRGQITQCRKAGDGKYLFFFASGQIWKQVKSSKKRYKNCNFAVTISEDIFGFKMEIDGRRGNIRISRKR